VLLEVASHAAYVFIFHRLFARPGSPIGGHEHAARVVGLMAEAAAKLGEGARGALHLVRTSDPAVVGCFLLVSPRHRCPVGVL
jgi:hypothetical protein